MIMTYEERKSKEPDKVIEDIERFMKVDTDAERKLSMIEKIFFGKTFQDFLIDKINRKTNRLETRFSTIPFTLLDREINKIRLTYPELTDLEQRIAPFWKQMEKSRTSPFNDVWKHYFPSWVFLREDREKSIPQAAKLILELAKARFQKVPSEKALTTQFTKLHKELKQFENKSTPTTPQLGESTLPD